MSNFSRPNHPLVHFKKLIEDIEDHYTIDTLAKKIFKKGQSLEYEFLKVFLASYFYFEQINKPFDHTISNAVIESAQNNGIYNKYKIEGKNYELSDEYNNLLTSIKNIVDYRYDSFFAALLEKNGDNITLPENINIISWNYDNQLEVAYKNYITDSDIEKIKETIQIFPPEYNYEIDLNKSRILKLNGTASFKSNSEYNINLTQAEILSNTNFDAWRALDISFSNGLLPETNIKFAWEIDKQVEDAKQYAHSILVESDVVVIIGYSFPTFNREIDRYIFKGFNDKCIVRKGIKKRYDWGEDEQYRIYKKIYIQDTVQNVSKVRERLKALGNNLYDVAEIYDDVDQFFIPPEL